MVIEDQKDASALSILYLALHGHPVELHPLPDSDDFPDDLPEHDMDGRREWADFYYRHFLSGVSYALVGAEQEIED